jgi:hypothetical protein
MPNVGPECRFIALTNVGKNWAGNDALVITAFEVIGQLVEPAE